MTKEEQGVRTLVATLLNHLSSIFKFPWNPFTLWMFLQILRSSLKNSYASKLFTTQITWNSSSTWR